MAAPLIGVVDDPAAAARAAANAFVAAADQAVGARGRFMVALSGGSTPARLYRLLTPAPERGGPAHAFSWSQVHVFWGDERCVPPDHPESNYRMVREALLDHVPIPPGQVHRIEAERADVHEAAARYEQTLRREFDVAAPNVPVFDLVLLGIGADGHTASLFPETTLLAEQQKLVAAGWVPRLAAWRMTLTVPVLTAGRQVLFLASGAEKAEAIARVLAPAPDPADIPARVVASRARHVHWILDRAAASRLGPGHFPSPVKAL